MKPDHVPSEVRYFGTGQRRFAGQLGVEVTAALAIQAWLPNGASDRIVRAVTENGRPLKFRSSALEGE